MESSSRPLRLVVLGLLLFPAMVATAAAHIGSQPPALGRTNDPGPQMARIATLEKQADRLVQSGDAAAAVPLLAEATRLYRALLGDRHPQTLIAINNYAATLDSSGRAQEAEPLFAEVLRTRRQTLGDRHPDTLNSMNNYAFVLNSLGRTDEAERLYAEALQISRDALGERHPRTLSLLNNYAFTLLDRGRPNEAAPLLARALELDREVLGGRHPDTITVLNNYATVLLDLGRFGEAEPLLAEGLRLSREVRGNAHPDTLNSLGNYAYVLERLGQLDRAAPLHAEALELSRRTLGDDHPATLAKLTNYAFILLSLGRGREAEALYAQALQRQRRVLGDRHPDTLATLTNYTVILVANGRAKEALRYSRELVQAARSRANILGEDRLRGSSQRDRELASRQSIERLDADVIWSNLDGYNSLPEPLALEGFAALQLASAGSTTRAVAEAAAARFADRAGLGQIVRERQGLAQYWARLEAALVESLAIPGGSARSQTLRQQIDAVEARIADIDARLSAEAPQYFAILNQQQVELDELRSVLRDDEAILFLVPAKFGTHSMVVTREAIRWNRADPTAEEIGGLVAKMRSGLEIRADDTALPRFDFSLAYQLYSDLVAPIESAFSGKSRVYAVADGALSRLPLGTLVTAPVGAEADPTDPDVLRSAQWLADRYALVQLPSLQSLVYVRSFAARQSGGGEGPGFMGFGAPMLGGGSRVRGARSATLSAIDAADLTSARRGDLGAPLMNPDALRRLAALPGTRSELERVRDAIGAPVDSLFLGERMTETSIRTADLSRIHILHLATHGFTSEESGAAAEPGLVFTPPGRAQPEDDGYLAASEVVRLDLGSAEWVILSACNTASPSGKLGETGLSGLAQAFFYAGAQSLLVSHWPVFDDIAPRLTVETLKRRQQGQPRAEALQATMRAIREDPFLDAAHPAVWAPFSLVGEGI